MIIAYETEFGVCYNAEVEKALTSEQFEKYRGNVDLIFTSPPFPLNRKKKYGNKEGDEYLAWLTEIGSLFYDYLSPTGSLVIELGNAWIKGSPSASLLPLKSLIAIMESCDYHLCQQFVWHNPAKLPSPAQWVNVERIRVKDAFTNIWWLSKSDRPKADNRRILTEYSKSMKTLLASGKYNSGIRPSEHNISEKSFLTDNSGAIPSNVITVANTQSSTSYQNYCKANGYPLHPARMPKALVEFFVKFLTEQGNLVLDPFGGSNTTGCVAETLKRNWITIEANPEYILGSAGRFESLAWKADLIKKD